MCKKYMVLMFVGMSIVALSFSATADEETPIQKIVSREVGSEDGPIDEPEVEPVDYDDINEDLLIAPNPDETVNHEPTKGEREYDNIVGEDCDPDMPHILGVDDSKDIGNFPKEVKREYENVVGEDCDQNTPHILDNGNNEENNEEALDATLSSTKNTNSIEENNLSYILIIGAIGVIGFLLIIAKKKK